MALRAINFIESTAKISEDKRYRYKLTRVWDKSKKRICFVGLNPSKADETENDPTVWKLVRYADSWGYGGMTVVNLFAIRTPRRRQMMREEEPIGPKNDAVLEHVAVSKEYDKVIAVWGDDGRYKNRNSEVKKLFSELWVLKVSKSGEPRHPRFLPGDLTPKLWKQ